MAEHHNVLIVEDDAAIRDVFGEVMRAAGHEVSVATNGAEAMDLLHDGAAPCLILADLLMPVLDGWGLAAELIKEPRLGSIPLVVLSAHPSSVPRETPPNARARLTKPISIDALLATVAQHCPGHAENGSFHRRRMARRQRSQRLPGRG